MNKLLLAGGLMLLLQANCSAQTNTDQTPYWVSVMSNDSTANYFQALDSFKKYWEGKELPMENDEYMHEERREKKEKYNREIREQRREREREEHEREERFARQEHQYDADFKRFMRWKDDMFVFVREDGSIPTAEERIRMINEQR